MSKKHIMFYFLFTGIAITMFSIIKKYFYSVRIFTISVWVLVPFFYILSSSLIIITEHGYRPNNLFFSPMTIPYAPITLLIPFPLLSWVLFFAIFPGILPTKQFFMIRGLTNVITEYRYLKLILYSYILFMIIIIIFYLYGTTDFIYKTLNDHDKMIVDQYHNENKKLLSGSISMEEYRKKLSNAILNDPKFEVLHKEFLDIVTLPTFYSFLHGFLTAVFTSIYMIAPIPISIIIKLLLEQSRKKFRFYFAKACFKVVNIETKDETEKSKYFKSGMYWYNKFIEKTIGLEIKNVDEIYSKIIANSSLNENKELDTLANTFDDENEVFKPLRYLSTIYSTPNEPMLVKKNFLSRFKESSDLLIPIVTTIITIITTFFLKPPT